jgi:hypothetical protein
VKRLLLAAAVAAGTFAVAAPAQAVPLCGPGVSVNCWNGARVCRVWIAATRTCI